ncbi:MAG: phosphoenolpyruvate--protein phosphotransferase [Myxococcales bacterium]|nr:phosphoenolpyruvate--protein phosphotransferase [Myxococcales bacterium]
MSRSARLQGIAASIGVAVGHARVIRREHRPHPHRRIEEAAISAELSRFAEAVASSRAEIEAAKEELLHKHGPTYTPILDVYLLMHGDALLIDAISNTIREESVNAEWAVSEVAARLKKPLLEDASPYFQERASDIDHVKEHLLRHLSGEQRQASPVDGPTIVIARDLTPADAVHVLAPPTVGLVTELGADSSHTTILARTFGVPAVVGLGPLPIEIEDGDVVLVDGFSGEVTLGASLDERRAAERRRDRFRAFLDAERSPNAVTRDGVSVSVAANIELPSEVEAALENAAEGVGLYRTEFMCLDQTEPPSEEEQVQLYRGVVRAMAPKPVVFRTFDWRGDKRLRVEHLGGCEQAWLETQIRAVLRAGVEGPVALMFPMIATVTEFREARALVQRCRDALVDESARLAPLPVGMMVEVPSAALLADRFAQHADFFSVGTNDLSHHALGADRHDGRSAAGPLDPAVLALLERAISAASDAGIPCSMCGGMAADPVSLVLALGLGYRQVSVPVSVVPLARAVIRDVDLGAAADAAREALDCVSADAVRELLLERLGPALGSLWKDHGLV